MRELVQGEIPCAKMMIAVAAALSLGGRFGDGHFGRGFRGGFRGLYGFGGILPYYGYGYGNSCYALTPYGYAWICT